MTAQLIQILLGTTVLWLATLLACACLRKHSAALRHALWASAMTGTLLIPFLSPFLPQLPLVLRDLPKPQTSSDTTQQPAISFHANATPLQTPDTPSQAVATNAAENTAIVQSQTNAKASPFGKWLFAGLCLWAIVAAVKLLGMISAMVAVKQLLRDAISEQTHQALPANIARKMRIRRPVRVMANPNVAVPYTVGLRRPVIFVPLESRAWSPDEQEAVLTHEAAHIARYDVFWQYLACFVCAIYWFHPLAWWAARRMQIERELACDDAVLHHGGKADHYADVLLELARAAKLKHRAKPLPVCAVSMARHSTVKQRILSILNPALNRRPLGRAKLIALIVLAAVVIFVAAMLVPFGELSEKQKLLRIAVPQDSVREITIKGKVLMPDGTPASHGAIFGKSILYTHTSFLGFSQYNGNHGSSGWTYVEDDTGTFECKADEGSNLLLAAVYEIDAVGGSSFFMNAANFEKHRLIAPPAVFVPKENMPEIVLQYEEGQLVEGTVTFDDGRPAVNQDLLVHQYVTPAIGADIPDVQKEMVVSRGTRIGEDGKFSLYLLPGEYTFVTGHTFQYEQREQKVTIERGKENRFALTSPSPIHVRFELEDGTSPENINVMHVGAYVFNGQDWPNTFLYSVFDKEENEKFGLTFQPGDAISVYPTEMNNYLIVTTYDNEYGLVEKITPQMRGKEITLTLRPTIKVTEKKSPSQKYIRKWEYRYISPKLYAFQYGVEGKNHVFESDENGQLTYAVPVYAGDYKDLFFFLETGESTDSGASGGLKKYQRKEKAKPLFFVDPKTQEIKPYSEP